MNVVICTLAILAVIIIFYNSLYRKIDKDCEELRKTVLDAQEELFSEIEDNWQAIQNVRSDISYSLREKN